MKINPTILKGVKSLFNNPFKHGIEGKLNNTAFFLPLGLAGVEGVSASIDNDNNNREAARNKTLNCFKCMGATFGGIFGIGGAVLAGIGMHMLAEHNKQFMA